MRVHELRSYPAFFEAVKAGRKPYEIRQAKRDYKYGDLLVLREFIPILNVYTRRVIFRRISYITPPGTSIKDCWKVPDNMVILGMSKVGPIEWLKLAWRYRMESAS